MEDLLAQVRARLPYVILMGNEISIRRMHPGSNGRLYEWQLRDILDGAEGADLGRYDGRLSALDKQWPVAAHHPHLSAPEAMYREKHSSESEPHILPAFQAEAAASYQRMRFGLTSALMGDGLFFYDLREAERPLVWYDEFGASGHGPAANLPPRGYLGQPTGDPYLVIDELDTPDQILNGDFEDGLNDWSFWANTGAGAAATVDVDPQGGVSGSAAAHFAVTSATRAVGRPAVPV